MLYNLLWSKYLVFGREPSSHLQFSSSKSVTFFLSQCRLPWWQFCLMTCRSNQGFMATGYITHYSLPVPLIPLFWLGWNKRKGLRGKAEKRREVKRWAGCRKLKRGNVVSECDWVTVSPSLWVWRCEQARNTVMGFSHRTQTRIIATIGKIETWLNRGLSSCYWWQKWMLCECGQSWTVKESSFVSKYLFRP